MPMAPIKNWWICSPSNKLKYIQDYKRLAVISLKGRI
jgi:hypothetical protein